MLYVRSPFGLNGGSQVISRVEEFTIPMLRFLTSLGTDRKSGVQIVTLFVIILYL